MNFYVIGEDKSLVDVTEVVLALTGGTMKGTIKAKSGTAALDAIRFIEGDDTGAGLAIGAGGTTVIGGGESAQYLKPDTSNASAEKMVIGSDGEIEFYVNCQNGVTAAKKVTLNTAGLLSGHQKAISSGTASPSGGSNGDIYIQY